MTENAAHPIMQIKDVAKSFGASPVFDKVNLTILNGSSTLIRGPSGCGKTTLLRCMAMLEPIDGGTIALDGTVVSQRGSIRIKRADRTKIGMVFQDLFLWPHLTIRNNIALPLYASRTMSKSEARARADTLLEELEIAEKTNAFPATLSGGQRQRVAIARALVHSPKLLLLDEITSNLDSESIRRVHDAVEIVWRKGTAVALATHRSEVPLIFQQQVIQFVSNRGRWSVEINGQQ